MNNNLKKNLKSIKGLVNGALILTYFPLLPIGWMLLLILFFCEFNIVYFLLGLLEGAWVLLPLFIVVLCLIPLHSLSRHVKVCLKKGERLSAKKVSRLRVFFTVAFIGCCGVGLCLIATYALAPAALGSFGLVTSFSVLCILIGSIFAFSAFNKARQACEK